ncbi:MAG TPA: CheR family methyltransferase [Dehalococcoidia bacterium]|nr:CheR family methyltransferase [Dehalococcoidia bacterium]
MAAEPHFSLVAERGVAPAEREPQRRRRVRGSAGVRVRGTSDGDVTAVPAEPQERRTSSDAEREAFGALLGRSLRSGGFRFDDATMSRLRRVLWERVRASGAGSAQAYLGRATDPLEVEQIHAALAVHETRFFRMPTQFKLLDEDILPALWFRRGSDTRLLLWSAGCASGEEAYSLGMVALEAAIRRGVTLAEPVRVIGSDIDGAALHLAERAIYHDRALANVAPALRSRCFVRAGQGWRVAETPRRLVEFQRWSLLDADWPLAPGSVDVLFCHDVLPFFSAEERQAVVARFCDVLAPGGYLFLGYGEALAPRPAALEDVHLPSISFYQKVAAGRE